MTLLSFHHDGQHDYLDAQLAGLPAKQQLEDYFTRMLAGLKQFHDADVLAHFDYGLRLFDITPEQLEAWGKPLLDQIFAIAVAHDLALELNTKSMYRWHNAPLYDQAIAGISRQAAICLRLAVMLMKVRIMKPTLNRHWPC